MPSPLPPRPGWYPEPERGTIRKGVKNLTLPGSAKPRRSAAPRDLRTAGPAGAVERYWKPESFEWYGFGHGSKRGGCNVPFIAITKNQIRISAAAAEMSGFKPGDQVEIGRNSSFLAIRKSGTGIVAKPEPKNNAIFVRAVQIIKKLIDESWPIPCRVICHWDERSEMLVAEKPQGGAS